jgi:hypothetical protein
MQSCAIRTGPRFALVMAWLVATASAHAGDPPPPAASAIDCLLAKHWKKHEIKPAAAADDLTLFRRVTLDLAGRVPTVRELNAFEAEKGGRYESAVQRLMDSPEFAWYFATVLDEIIQDRYAGSEPFVDYLRAALKQGRSWDTIFRDVMVGPWEGKKPGEVQKGAVGFLGRRTKDIDALTVDTTRAFFGVDISCARCHDHPLVKDWKRNHYYGMAAFLVRTAGGPTSVTEKKDGEAKFAGRDGKEQVAPMMFLTGRVVGVPASAGSAHKAPAKAGTPTAGTRRDALVRIALEERTFLSRAFVNRMWDYFFSQGLVHPVDQMHSGNPASVPALLDQLADDFAASGYDIRKLITAIVLSKAYRLDSRYAGDRLPDPGHFAVARLRPLSPRQLARSLAIVLGDGTFNATPEQLSALDKEAATLMPLLDPRITDFQSSSREALFVSNGDAIRKLLTAGDKSLVARLAATTDDRELLKTAIRTIHGRPATANELSDLESWVKRHGGDRRAMCEDLVWALVASAEFRFGH